MSLIPMVAAVIVERLASEIRVEAGYRPTDVPLSPEIARCILGEHGVRFCRSGGVAHFDGTTIVVPADHDDLNGAVAHELGHFAILRDREARRVCAADHVLHERCANWFMVSLLVRDEALASCWRADWPSRAIAEALGVPTSYIAARRAQRSALNGVPNASSSLRRAMSRLARIAS